MKQLVILSGKGGTGKTSVTAALAHLAAQGDLAGGTVLADADVDAANLELVLRPQRREEQDFNGGKVARIDPEACAACGTCEAVCRFDAIHHADGRYVVDPIACDGCAACVHQCPTRCISMQEHVAGRFLSSESRYGPLYHANLFAGQENSGRLVTLVRQRARLRALDERRELVIVDGPPGIGCPVISAVSGASLALIVAEPTVSGVHDMRRVLQLVKHFGVPAVVCVNKADIYPAGAVEIETYCRENGLDLVGRIPFDAQVARAIVAGEAVTAFQPGAPSSVAITELWARLLPILRGPEPRVP